MGTCAQHDTRAPILREERSGTLRLVTAHPLPYPLARLTRAGKLGHNHVGTVGAGSEQHAFADTEAHLAWLQVGNHNDLFTDQLFWRIGLANAGKDGALFSANADPQAQELVGSFYN